jgi:hypothetical protein
MVVDRPPECRTGGRKDAAVAMPHSCDDAERWWRVDVTNDARYAERECGCETRGLRGFAAKPGSPRAMNGRPSRPKKCGHTQLRKPSWDLHPQAKTRVWQQKHQNPR